MKFSLSFFAIVIAFGTQFLSTTSTFGLPAAPKISNFSPAQGTVGTSVAIEGTGLTGIQSVRFNGAQASFTILADIVTAIVPTNATTGPITVQTTNGTAISTNVFTVTVAAAPIISGFSPTEGEAGVSVEIRGTNFVGVSSVKFNGQEASFTLLAGLLSATVPPTATSGPISVTTPGGTATSSASFTVTRRGAPVVSGFSPTSGPVGSSVEIQGTDLVNVTKVEFNGLNAAFLSFSGSLRATVPPNATSGPITVTTATGSSKSAASFTVTSGPPPSISDFTPALGGIGTSVEIHGAFLRDASSVKFNGVEARFTTSLFQPLTAIVPTNATTGPITVTTKSGTATSAEPFVVFNPFAPEITRFSTNSAPPGQLIDILGTNLTGVLSVEFQGATASFIEFRSDRLFVFVPATAQSGPVRVATRFGMAVSKDIFTVVGAVPAEPPALSIQATSPKQIELSWKVTAGFRLETSDSMTAPIQWSASTLQVVENQGRAVVVIAPDARVRFYRLRQF